MARTTVKQLPKQTKSAKSAKSVSKPAKAVDARKAPVPGVRG